MTSTRLYILLLCAALIIICYAPTLGGMFDQWWTDEDMGHGFVVPAVILWIMWRDQAPCQTLPIRGSACGFVALAPGGISRIVCPVWPGTFSRSITLLVHISQEE